MAGDADEILASRLKRVLESDASEEKSTRDHASSTKDGESVLAGKMNYKGVSKRRERMQRLRDRIRRSSREGSLRDAREGMLKTARRRLLRGSRSVRDSDEQGTSGGRVGDAVLLYPTFANQDREHPGSWRVHVRGWIYRPRDIGMRHLTAAAAPMRYLRIRPGQAEYHQFAQRTCYFVVRNRRGSSVAIQCCSDNKELDSCGVATISTTESDRFGHFWEEEVLCEEELPMEVAEALPAVGTESDNGAPFSMSLRTVSYSMKEVKGKLKRRSLRKRMRDRIMTSEMVEDDEGAFSSDDEEVNEGEDEEGEEEEIFYDEDEDDEEFDLGLEELMGGEDFSAATSELGPFRSDTGRASEGSTGRSTIGERGTVYFVPPRGVSIISDIDDTVKVTAVLETEEMLANTFLREFKAVPGMDRLYGIWAEQGAAFHYVSSSPWQLQPELQHFFQKTGLPGGTFHLKDFDIRNRRLFNVFTPSTKTKPIVIRRIMECFPERRFILVGDSGEKDPEIYAELMREYPQQIAHCYIRRVANDGRDDPPSEKHINIQRHQETPTRPGYESGGSVSLDGSVAPFKTPTTAAKVEPSSHPSLNTTFSDSSLASVLSTELFNHWTHEIFTGVDSSRWTIFRDPDIDLLQKDSRHRDLSQIAPLLCADNKIPGPSELRDNSWKWSGEAEGVR